MEVVFFLVNKQRIKKVEEELIVHQNLMASGIGLGTKYLLSKI
jgi:hypothetical protein